MNRRRLVMISVVVVLAILVVSIWRCGAPSVDFIDAVGNSRDSQGYHHPSEQPGT